MRQKLKSLSQNKFVQGSFYYTAGTIITGLINYAFSVLTGRALGPEGYGEFSALFSYLTITAVPLAVISTVVIQKIGHRPNDNRAYARMLEKWFITKNKRWAMVFILSFLLLPVLPKLTNLSPLVAYSIIPLQILSIFLAFYDGAIQGFQMFKIYSILGIITVLVKLLGPIFAFTGFRQIELILFFFALAHIVRLIYIKHFFNKEVINPTTTIEPSPKRLRELFFDKQIWITTISLLSINLLNNIDIVFVKKYFSAHEAGIYSSWSLFAKIILYIISPLLSISFVFFTSKKEEGNHRSILLYTLLFLICCGIISYTGYTIFSPTLVTIFFGHKFASVIPHLSSASIFGSLYVAILYLNNFFLAKRSWQALILSTILPIYILFLFFIPKTIAAITQLNIYFALTSVIIYLVAYWFSSRVTK